MSALVVDLGGTFLRCGVAACAGDGASVSHVRRTRILNFLSGASSEAIWKSIVSGIASYAVEADALLDRDDPIMLSFPGPIRRPSTIVAAPTITGNEPVPDVGSMIEAATGRRVRMLNDISAAAWYLSEKLTADRFMVVTISSGVGSKVFDRRHPDGVLDDLPYAGEIGHCVVDLEPDAPLCDCGGRGHLGAIASGRGTERLARLAARTQAAAFAASACAREYGATAENLTNEAHLVPAARAGDPWASGVIRLAALPLANAIGAIAFAVGLERVVIIGGFALELGPAYIEMLRSHLRARENGAPIGIRDADFLTAGDMHADACLLGAAAFAKRQVVRTG